MVVDEVFVSLGYIDTVIDTGTHYSLMEIRVICHTVAVQYFDLLSVFTARDICRAPASIMG